MQRSTLSLSGTTHVPLTKTLTVRALKPEKTHMYYGLPGCLRLMNAAGKSIQVISNVRLTSYERSSETVLSCSQESPSLKTRLRRSPRFARFFCPPVRSVCQEQNSTT